MPFDRSYFKYTQSGNDLQICHYFYFKMRRIEAQLLMNI